jgi:cytochrome oxidase Cu insertion factor (SCO1/SenC/PrrC family)
VALVLRILVAALVATACAPAPAARATPAGPAEARAAVLATTVADVRSGQAFRLDQFKGKVVIVLGIAAW